MKIYSNFMQNIKMHISKKSPGKIVSFTFTLIKIINLGQVKWEWTKSSSSDGPSE